MTELDYRQASARLGRPPALSEQSGGGAGVGATAAHVAPSAQPAQVGSAALLRVLEAQAVILEANGFREASEAFVAAVARLHGFDRVSLGWVSPRGARVVVQSQSASRALAPEAVAPLAAAMNEALDQQTSLQWPVPAGAGLLLLRAHANLARLNAANGVCTIVLAEQGRCVGLLCCERDAGPIEPDTLEALDHLAAFAAPTLALAWRAERPLGALAESVRRRTRGRDRKLAAGAVAVLALAVIALWPVDARVSAPARVEGAVQRTLTAPSDGYLLRAGVRPGDTVKADQILVELDDRDLVIERLRWSTEADQYARQATEALARDDRAQYAVHAAKAAQSRAQLGMVEAQLARYQVRAPFDGIVLQGDLTRSLGAPVRAGDTLMTIAPEGDFRIILDVDERDIARLSREQTGELSLSARAGERLPIRLVRLSPTAVIRDGRNVFEVEATPQTVDAGLRPGYHGVAKVDAGERPLWRVLFERPLRWLGQQLWAWGL
jgi:multidrug efflux pump subunit AcrA (membrane-fusion protein)